MTFLIDLLCICFFVAASIYPWRSISSEHNDWPEAPSGVTSLWRSSMNNFDEDCRVLHTNNTITNGHTNLWVPPDSSGVWIFFVRQYRRRNSCWLVRSLGVWLHLNGFCWYLYVWGLLDTEWCLLMRMSEWKGQLSSHHHCGTSDKKSEASFLCIEYPSCRKGLCAQWRRHCWWHI